MTHKTIPTTWPIKPHTIAKHHILEEYLKAWFPILARWAPQIVYIDGFAGPGKYQDDIDGSPVIAVNTAINHDMLQSTTNITFGFIENDKERSKVLKQTLKEKFPKIPSNMSLQVIDSNFQETVENMLDRLNKRNETLPPTFAFIDPFGYSGFPMTLIRRLLDNDKCEVLITFMSSFVNRFLDPSHENANIQLYGSDEFKKANNIGNTDKRINFLLELYKKKLMENNGVKFVRSFEMLGSDNNIIYHLIFGTRHWKGLEVMKKAMLKVDSRGTYSFSDRLGSEQTFFVTVKDEAEWMPKVAKLIFQHFRNESVKLIDIHKFVITNTPYLFKKEILKFLERKDHPQIQSVSHRKTKQLTYRDDCTITFSE